MGFDHLYSNAPIERQLTYRDKTETVYFKRLTAGERIEMRRGSIGTVKGGEATVNLDLSEADKRNSQFLFYVLCKSDGKRALKNMQEVHEMPSDFFDALVKLANDALAEPEEERLASNVELRFLCRLAFMFKTPLHEVLDWPAWEVALLAEYLSKEPPADERAEIAIAHMTTLYVNSKRRKGDPPHSLRDFLLFRDAWKEDEPEGESLEAFALSLGGTVKRGNNHS